MLVLLGTLGVAQALFLPGLIAARALGVRGGARLASAAFALSLPIGFALASVLVPAGLWRRETFLALLALEVALAWWLFSRARRASPPPAPLATRLTLAEGVAAAALAGLALWYVGRVARAATGIFSGWDDVASWNRWAMSWFRGVFPDHTWNYPQGLPVAWATTYAFLGTDLVQAFARGMMPLFGLVAMLALAASGPAPARLRSLAAAWFAGTFLARVNNVTAGLADVPVACLAAIAMAEFLREAPDAESGAEGRGPARGLRLALFSASAALVKQAGLYLALVLPALHAAREPRGRRLRSALLGLGVVALVVAPWYALKQWEIAAGRETSEVLHVLTGAHVTADPLARARLGFARLADLAGGAPVLVALAALGLAGLRERAVRPLVLGVALPFTALWAFGFSYDPRNLSIGLVAWAIGCGAGLASIPGIARGPGIVLPRAPRGAPLAVAAGGAAALAALALAVPDARLLEHSRRLQRGLGDPEVAGALADLRDADQLDGTIAADPGVLLAYAPGWESRFAVAPMADSARRAEALARPGIEWALVPAAAGGPPGDSAWVVEREFSRAALWRRRR